jgi:phosphate transport system permease protein
VAAALRHAAGRHAGDPDGGPAEHRAGAGDLPLRAASARQADRLPHRPARRRPSVVYGLWGISFLRVELYPVYDWLARNLNWLPFFEGPANGRSILTASIVLAIMALPIITAICREIFSQTPTLHQEAALALGATRWEMIRMTVFPYGRSGMVSAVMLGLGRALGETMAVAMVLSATGVVTFNLISSVNPSTIAANIALSFPEATGVDVNVLIFSGLVLFVFTFAVNFAGRYIATRGVVKEAR